nr:NAD-dependent epimerase/dehydratase family protein [Rubrobacter sp.]
MSPRNVLVTGGAGFVGSNLAIRHKEHHPDSRVTALDNLKRRGSELNLPRLRQAGVEFVHGDIRNREDLAGLEAGLILECSAEPSVLAGYSSSPEYLLDTNLSGTLNCLELARRRSADFVFLSTSRVYPIQALGGLRYTEQETRFVLENEQPYPGASAHGIAEEFPLAGARSLYGATKLASEMFVEEYGAAFGLRTVVNRCGVITGPWQMGKVDQGVFALWVARHYFGGELSYLGYGGTGKQVRDLLHVDDLYELIDHQAHDPGLFDGGTFNVGGG